MSPFPHDVSMVISFVIHPNFLSFFFLNSIPDFSSIRFSPSLRFSFLASIFFLSSTFFEPPQPPPPHPPHLSSSIGPLCSPVSAQRRGVCERLARPQWTETQRAFRCSEFCWSFGCICTQISKSFDLCRSFHRLQHMKHTLSRKKKDKHRPAFHLSV